MPAPLRRAAQAVLAHPPVGLFTDIDGTIAALAPRPDLAHVDRRARDTLARLAGTLAAVVVLTGRPAAEAQRMVGVDGLIYIGNHGLERLEGGRLARPAASEMATDALAAISPRLEEALRDQPGILLEPKGPLLGIHYRNAPDPAAARARILAACAALAPGSLRVAEGKQVVELQPAVAFDKGLALRAIAAERGLRGMVVLGDDRTDLEAFAAARALREAGGCRALLVGVAGPEPLAEIAAAADYLLPDVHEVVKFLAWLADSGER